MIFTIHKGRHRASRPVFGVYYNKTSMVRDVMFDFSCKYDLPGTYDDHDVNKLFGLGYWPGHLKESARFGWSYNNETNKVRLYSYCHIEGVMQIVFLTEVRLYQRIRLSLNVTDVHYCFKVQDSINGKELAWTSVPYTHEHKLSYRLGCYFGGNQPAPELMTIRIDKV